MLNRGKTQMLTELAVQSLKIKDKRYMKADRDGLYVEVVPGGQKYWWFVSQAGGKRRKTSLGRWPEMSLKEAREELILAKRKAGIKCLDPEVKQITFGEMAEEWYRIALDGCSDKYKAKNRHWLDNYVYLKLKDRPLASVTTSDVLDCCRMAEDQNYRETAHRILSVCSRVFKYAMPTYIQGDPRANLVSKLKPTRARHYAKLTDPRDIALLMKGIDGYSRPLVRNALLFSAYMFGRPGAEICQCKWEEIDFDRQQWRRKWDSMKSRREHVYPLPRQAVQILRDEEQLLKAIHKDTGPYVFPGARSDQRPMSADTVRLAIRALGFDAEEMTAHGFRGMASTLLNESGLWTKDAIELQLAHLDRDKTRAAYNEASLIPERTRMMQWYADELDRLRKGKPKKAKKENDSNA